MSIFGLDLVDKYHRARTKQRLFYELQRRREQRAASGQSLKFRRHKQAPPLALVEQQIVPMLNDVSPDAARALMTLCRYANKHTGLAYPSNGTLIDSLGGVPLYKNFTTGRTRVGLTKEQRQRRANQNARREARLDSALEELERANLIARTTKIIKSPGNYTDVPAFQILHPDGTPRNFRRLLRRHGFFKIPGHLFDNGAFGIWKRNVRCPFQPVSDLTLRVLILALRDNDDLRFGGINPDKLTLQDSAIVVNPDGWPAELTISIRDCIVSIDELLQRRVLKSTTAIFSARYGQIIDRFREQPASKDELARVVFYFA
jgi:hypothetical protein